jgi:hypothetical protein
MQEKIVTPTSMVEMIHNLIAEQNRQLLMIIAKKEDLDFETLIRAYIKPLPIFKMELESLAIASESKASKASKASK